MSYMVLDTETPTIEYKGRKASPFHPDCFPIIIINKHRNEPTLVNFLPQFYDAGLPKDYNYSLGIRPDTKLLIGHNLKFDLLHLWEHPELAAFLKRGGKIWDTQLAEYLLQGQDPDLMWCTLDDVIDWYGGILKPDLVKMAWNDGKCTREIDEGILEEYCIGDGDNPELVFEGQIKEATKLHPQMINGIMARMDSLLATTMMEYNGLKVDEKRAEKDRTELLEELEELQAELDAALPTDFPEEFAFNWGSPQHKSFLLFGGTAKYGKWTQHLDPNSLEPMYAKKTEKWPLFDGECVEPMGCTLQPDGLFARNSDNKVQDVFKSGKRKGEGKTKNVQVPDYSKPKGAKKEYGYTFKGVTTPLDKWKGKNTDFNGKPIYSTGADVIEVLGNRDIPFLRSLSRRSRIDKLLTSFYWMPDKNGEPSGMMTKINEFDGKIHHSLNHCATVTTRLSSSDPNLQNIPRGDKSTVKAMFVSRFENGRVGEIDYSQLEVIVQALLSGDKNLILDICNAIDTHCKRLAQRLGEEYEEVVKKSKDPKHAEYEEYSNGRTDSKAFSFQRAYGAGVPAIHEATGISIEILEELVIAEEANYPGVVQFNDSVAAACQASRTNSGSTCFTSKGPRAVGVGEWYSPTGTRYKFFEKEAPKFMQKKGMMMSFSPPDQKNYPVQGTGGEIVQLVLGKLFRLFIHTDNYGGKAALCNTVHDCVWLDMDNSVHDKVMEDCIRVMQGVPTFLKQTFNIDCPVPFRVEAESGLNMLEQEHFHSKHYIGKTEVLC